MKVLGIENEGRREGEWNGSIGNRKWGRGEKENGTKRERGGINARG